jgi:hypothetical protein
MIPTPADTESESTDAQILQHLIWTLGGSPSAHEAWLQLLSQKLVLSHLPRPTYRLIASTNIPRTRNERTARSTIVVGLMGAWTEPANQIGVIRYGDDLAVIVTCMTELYVPRYAHARLLPIQMVAEHLQALAAEPHPLLSHSERERIEGFLGAVEKMRATKGIPRADDRPRGELPGSGSGWRASILFGMAMLVAAALGGFAAEHPGRDLPWLTVTAATALVIALIVIGFAFVGRQQSPVRRQDHHDVGDSTRQKPGYATETLAAVVGVLAVDLVYSLASLDTGRGRPLFVLLLVVGGALPPALVYEFSRRKWRLRWLVAIDGVLAAIDAFRPFRWLSSAATAVGAGLTSLAVTLVVLQAAPGAQGPAMLTGLWEYKKLTVKSSPGWLKDTDWRWETWSVVPWTKCHPASCPYQVASSDGSSFTLWPIGHSHRSWYGRRHTLSECAAETKPNVKITLEPNGYEDSETLDMTLGAAVRSGRPQATIMDSIASTATEAAVTKGCHPTINAKLIAEAALRWGPPAS